MVLGKVERYTIEQGPKGVTITMIQRRNAAGMALFAGAIVLVSWFFGPYGPRPSPGFKSSPRFFWVWVGGWSLFVVLAVVGWFYRSVCTISDQAISWSGSWLGRVKTAQIPRVQVVKWLVISVPPTTHPRPVFPYQLQLVSHEGKQVGEAFEFTFQRSIEEFLRALRLVLTLDVEQTPPEHGSV